MKTIDSIMITRIEDFALKASLVIEFSNYFYNSILDIDTVEKLSKKIAESAIVLAGQMDETIIGLVAYYRNNVMERTSYISVIAVKPQFQGKGLGTLLIQNVISDCVEHNYATIRLEVDNANDTAIKLYKKFGFQKEDRASDHSFYYSMSL